MPIEQICRHEPIVISRNASLSQAAQMMKEHNIGSIVVVEDEETKREPVGIITDRDITIKAVADNKDGNTIVEEAMSEDVLTLSHDQSIQDALASMQDKCVRRAPVVDEEGNVCGMVAADDLLCLLAKELNTLSQLVEGQIKRDGA